MIQVTELFVCACVACCACCHDRHRGKISCKRLWQIGMEHGQEEDYYEDDDNESEVNMGGPKSICNWLKGPSEGASTSRGSTGLWVNVFDSGPNPGKVCCSSCLQEPQLAACL
jgi:hypothetical protein